jgi:hypothetical protein
VPTNFDFSFSFCKKVLGILGMPPKLSCVLIVEAAHKRWLFWKDRAGQACLSPSIVVSDRVGDLLVMR